MCGTTEQQHKFIMSFTAKIQKSGVFSKQSQEVIALPLLFCVIGKPSLELFLLIILGHVMSPYGDKEVSEKFALHVLDKL